MPYGLTNMSTVFQSFVNEHFHNLLGNCVIVYIDDILIYSKTMIYFSKACRLVLLKGLPNAIDTAKVLVHNVFRFSLP